MARIARSIILLTLGLAAMLAATGCAQPINPSFDITLSKARAELKAIPKDSLELERPLVIASGFLDPGFGVSSLTRQMRALAADPDMVIEVPFFTTPTFAQARERFIEKVETAYPSPDPLHTVEVDVIGISMGGLVSRFAAMPDEDAQKQGLKRLRIRTLFTLGTPHHGAIKANSTPAFDARVADMRAESDFINQLNNAWADRDYQLIAYTRLYDSVVGTANALDPDGNGWWLCPPPFQLSHMTMHQDPRILMDIICRLTGQLPLTSGECAPLPE